MTGESDRSAPLHVWPLLLAAVEALHGRGLTGIRALPHFGPVGYWRVAITTADNLSSGINLPERDPESVLRLTEGDFPRLGAVTVTGRTTVDEVADELHRRLGAPREATYFNDAEYCRWFAAMRRRAEEIGAPPSAFDDHHSGWRCGTTEIEPPPGWTSTT